VSSLATPLQRNVELRQYPVPRARPAVAIGGCRKRAFDICGATVAILFLSPLLFLLALIIKIADGGPVLFRDRRIGRNGVSFQYLRFRTMVPNSDKVLERHLAFNSEAGREWEQTGKLTHDPRITRLGQILRTMNLDELPLLFNILNGQMSFVGPHPIAAAEIPRYGVQIASYLRARPGLTGAWQVNGSEDVSVEGRAGLDHEYVENWGFMQDMTIILKTFYVVVTSPEYY
jgi:exopolysaccharide production protein ExoY